MLPKEQNRRYERETGERNSFSHQSETEKATRFHQCIKKVQLIHAVEYYPASKRKGTFISAITQKNLEGTTLNDISVTMRQIQCAHLGKEVRVTRDNRRVAARGRES